MKQFIEEFKQFIARGSGKSNQLLRASEVLDLGGMDSSILEKFELSSPM